MDDSPSLTDDSRSPFARFLQAFGGPLALILSFLPWVLQDLPIVGRIIIWIIIVVLATYVVSSYLQHRRWMRLIVSGIVLIISTSVAGWNIWQAQRAKTATPPTADEIADKVVDKVIDKLKTTTGNATPTPTPAPAQPPPQTAEPKKQQPRKPSLQPTVPKALDQLLSRVRITKVLVVAPQANPLGWPVVNVYYDVVGSEPVTGPVVRYSAGISSGQIAPEKVIEEQDNLLRWTGWADLMKSRSLRELHPGDDGEFTTIPPENNELAADFKDKFDDIAAGKAVLYLFVGWKYRTASMPANTVGVTEDCFWFSGGNFARHTCGRSRSFLERQ